MRERIPTSVNGLSGERLWDRLEKPFTYDDRRIASQRDDIASSERHPIEEFDDRRGIASCNYGPREWFPTDLKMVLGEYATDRVPTRLEKPSSGRRESLHRDRGFGVDKVPPRMAPGEQYGPIVQFGIRFESEQVVVASGSGLLGRGCPRRSAPLQGVPGSR